MSYEEGWHALPSQYLYAPAGGIALDPHSELLWASNGVGTVTSYFCSPSTGLAGRYTSYRAHPTHVSEFQVDSSGVLSVGTHDKPGSSKPTGSVKLANRRGMTVWNSLVDFPLHTFAYTPSRPSEITAAGGTACAQVSLNRGTVIRQQFCSVPITLLRRSTNLVAATASGSIALLDPRAAELKMQESTLAHSGGVTQLEVEGNYIVSLGSTMRQGRPLPDQVLRLYDARFLRPLSPIPFPLPPVLVKFHPLMPTTVFVSSAEGRVQILDVKDVSHGEVFQVETNSFLTSMAVASTGEGVAFGDAEGYLHLWSARQDASFTRFQSAIELPDPPPPLETIDWRPDTPLNSVGMPYYDSPLLSLLPVGLDKPKTADRSKQVIDPAILASVKVVDFVGYGPYPASARAAARRNQVQSTNVSKAKRRMDVPLFRSERERAQQRKPLNRSVSTDKKDEDTIEAEETNMPRYYRKVEIKYSRFGIEDFDFGFYNKTSCSGLETHVTNSYTNAILQALNYTPPLRQLAKSHTHVNCEKPNCLLCELGFLFRMLSDAKGVNCQSSNFTRAFAAAPQVSALGLVDLDPDNASSGYASMIQTCTRYLLEQITVESTLGGFPKRIVKDPTVGDRSPLAQLLRIDAQLVSTCSNCSASVERDTAMNVIDLLYPRTAMSNEAPQAADFASILRASIARETIARMQCTKCRQNSHFRMRRRLAPGSVLPPVMILNAGVRTSDELEHWLDGAAGQRFLQPSFSISKEGDSIAAGTTGESDGRVLYKLRAMVCQIQADDDQPHLVALARVSDSDSSWHLFNDFLVRPVSEQEALAFPGSWKIPAVLIYERADAQEAVDTSVMPLSSDDSMLRKDFNIAKRRDAKLVKHEVVKPDEVLRKGTLVSIDAEFVSLQLEEAEFHSDGTKKVLRPSRLSLARVSVLRGEGPDTGVPMIDDHIHTSDPIVDYLTEFSGIVAGDLDPNTSRHTLVSLKVAYKKLRTLVDLGCIFIGHGLKKDFRIINIYVPPEQIIDTVNIYYLPELQRRLSLRFLAWAVLHSKIQAESHDSIEDARTALQLYELHQRLEAEGSWEQTLEDVYRDGRLTNFKVPDQQPRPPSPTLGVGPGAVVGGATPAEGVSPRPAHRSIPPR